MLAAVTREPNVMEMAEVPDARDPGPGEALLRTEAVGLCGSDYHFLTGEIVTTTVHGPQFPKIQGHEVAQPEAPSEGGGAVLDLMAALEASVAEAKRARGETVAPSRPAAKKTAAKAAPKKSAPRKAAPKKTTATKATAAKKPGEAATTKKTTKKAPAKTGTKTASQRKTA